MKPSPACTPQLQDYSTVSTMSNCFPGRTTGGANLLFGMMYYLAHHGCFSRLMLVLYLWLTYIHTLGHHILPNDGWSEVWRPMLLASPPRLH